MDCAAYASVAELFEESVAKYGSSVAYECMGKTLSFQELDRLSAHFASYLLKELKLAKGSRVAIQMPNVLQYPVVMFGALRAGMVVVNTNPLYTPAEMRHQFNDSGADVVVIEFPSRAAAEAWYHGPEYQAILPHRLANSDGHIVLVDGFDG